MAKKPITAKKLKHELFGELTLGADRKTYETEIRWRGFNVSVSLSPNGCIADHVLWQASSLVTDQNGWDTRIQSFAKEQIGEISSWSPMSHLTPRTFSRVLRSLCPIIIHIEAEDESFIVVTVDFKSSDKNFPVGASEFALSFTSVIGPKMDSVLLMGGD